MATFPVHWKAWGGVEKAAEQWAEILDYYQEQPHLLDAHIPELLDPLLLQIRAIAQAPPAHPPGTLRPLRPLRIAGEGLRGGRHRPLRPRRLPLHQAPGQGPRRQGPALSLPIEMRARW